METTLRKRPSAVQSSFRSLLVLGFFIALTISFVLENYPQKKAYPDLENLSEEDLIGLLRLETELWCEGYSGLDFKRPLILTDRNNFYFDQEKFFKWPPPFSIQKELVRRGANAIPYLLDHLDDDRKTRATFGKGSVLSQNIVAYAISFYEMRDLNFDGLPDAQVGEGSAKPLDDSPEDLQLTVGDFCLGILGQIVNRDMGPIHLVGRGSRLESPVLIPELAVRVRKDWTGLTSEGLRQSLIRDCFFHPDVASPIRALKRLLVYYPVDGKKMLLNWLLREEINTIEILKLVEKNDIDFDSLKIDKLINDNNATNIIPYVLKYDVSLENRENADRILNKYYKKFNFYSPNFFWADKYKYWILFTHKDDFIVEKLNDITRDILSEIKTISLRHIFNYLTALIQSRPKTTVSFVG